MVTSKLVEPFKIFVVWDEKFAEGQTYAKKIFDEFSRKENDYSGESIGIPVKYILSPFHHIKDDLQICKYAAVVLLIDNNMVLNKNRWANILKAICDECTEEKRLYPVVLCSKKAAKQLSSLINEINFIVLSSQGQFEKATKNLDQQIKTLNFELIHEFSRLLYGCNRKAELEPPSAPPAIKIFFSYVREDGKNYANDFNKYLTTNTSLDRFIDCLNIPKGDNFENTINQNIDSAALLILCTDLYSSREWCQHEVLYAKRRNRPILLVDMLKEGEKRRFPYMANLRTVHLEYGEITDDKKELIIMQLLFETLRVKYSQMYMEYILELYSIKNVAIFPYPPELYTLLLNMEEKDYNTVLYSEPPLNKRELSILTTYRPNTNFVTPTYLLCNSDCSCKYDLSNIAIGLSVSELSEENLVKTNSQIKIMVIELCRYLIALGAQIIYGGNIALSTKYNFVDILNDIIANYSLGETSRTIVKNYYFSDSPVPIEKMAEFGNFEFVKIDMQQTGESRSELFAKGLSKLRRTINDQSDLRIVIGGKLEGYSGIMPGVIEETIIAIKQSKPVYILGAYGGAAELLSDCIKRGDFSKLTKWTTAFDDICKDYYCLNNGLSKEENELLFESDNMALNISLILKGINRISCKGSSTCKDV